MVEGIGFVLAALVFVLSGFNHIKNHAGVVGYSTPAYGNCPFAKQLGYISGWPTGAFLLATGIGIAFQQELALYAGAAFLAVTLAVFHRNLKDPANLKHVALGGALLALAALV